MWVCVIGPAGASESKSPSLVQSPAILDLRQAGTHSPLTTVTASGIGSCLGTADRWHLFGAGIGWYAQQPPVALIG